MSVISTEPAEDDLSRLSEVREPAGGVGLIDVECSFDYLSSR